MLKITKSRYLRNGLTDLYEIWYDDAKQVSSPLRPFNNLNFRNLRRRTDKLQFLYYHGLRGSASPVLTATCFVNGRWQFSTPPESTPLGRSRKNLLLVITSVTPTAVPNLVQIRPRGASGQMGEI